MFAELNYIRAAITGRAICFLVCIVCCLSNVMASNVMAQEDSRESTKPSDGDANAAKGVVVEPLVSGSVVDKAGHPVADAQVWLVGGNYDAPITELGETRTDANGEFAFDNLPAEEVVFENPGRLCVWARDPNAGLGWLKGLYDHRRKPLTVKLGPMKRFAGQLVGSAGQPIPDVKITPMILSAKSLGESGSRSAPLSPEMSQRLSTTTTDDGKFDIEDLPGDGVVSCDVAAPGFEGLRVNWNLHKAIITKLDPGVSFSGRVVWPAEVMIPEEEDFEFGKVTLFSYSQFQADGSVSTDGKNVVFGTQNSYSVGIDNKGRFHLDQIAPGEYDVSAQLSQRLPLLLSKTGKLEIKPETVVENFELVAEKAFKISGRVIGFENRNPVPNAVVQIFRRVPGGIVPLQRTTTDENGEYVAFTKQGKHTLRVAEAPPAFIPTADSYDSEFAQARNPTIDVTGDTVFPDLELDPACDVTIEVFDENGKPASGAIVKIVTVAGYPVGNDHRTEQRTDAEGKYVARRVTVNDTLPITVRTPTAISELDLVITPSELSGPLRIDLSPDHGVRFRCRVVDREDQPIAGATVSIGTYYPYSSKWLNAERGSAISGSAGQGKTDTEGYFETGPLWPDRPYRLTAKAEGFDLNESPRASGNRGEIVELKPMVLATIKAAKIVGTVVDQDNKTVEGVRVFAAGKGYARASTRTDANGHFELDEVAPDVRYVFADGGADYRLGGTRFGNQQPLEIIVRTIDSPPIGVRELRFLERDEQLQMARNLIDRALSVPAKNRTSSRLTILKALVHVDYQQAIETALGDGVAYEYIVRAEKAKLVADDDAEGALQILKTVRNRYGISAAIILAMRLAKSNLENDRKLALQFTELAQELSQGKVDYCPQLAALFTSLGQHEKAETLIKRALEPIDMENIAEDQKSFVIRMAPAVAPYDYEQARSFASLAKEGYSRTFALADVALAIVSTDHEKTIREIDALTGDSNAPNIRDKARLRAAFMLVATNPKRAIELVHQSEELGNRAQSLGRLAVSVAEFDKPQAWKMIDAALAIHRDHPDAYRSWSSYGGAGTFAAALAYHARLTDYPDMESVIWHVRAACRANSNRGQDRLAITIQTARILALVDRIAARDLLNVIADKTDQIPRNQGGIATLYDQWLQAWLLVDFGRGVKLLGEELDAMEESGAEDPVRDGHGEVFYLLVQPPDKRFNILLKETGLWKLEEDGSR